MTSEPRSAPAAPVATAEAAEAATVAEEAPVASSGRVAGHGNVGRFRRWIRELFFPEAVAPTGRPLWIVTALSGLFVLACIPLLLGWRWSPRPWNLIWAEDGPIFLHDAVLQPWSEAVLSPYQGYMHLAPRTAALLVAELPPQLWALAIAVGSILVRALLAVVVWHATSGHVPGRAARAVISVMIVTIPLGGVEVLNNLANLHWFLMLVSLPALLWRPRTWFGIVVQCLVVGVSMLSDPLTVLWAPIVVLRVLAVPRWRDQVVSAVFVICAALQLTVALRTSRERGPGFGVQEIYQAYVVRVVEPAFAGIEWTEWAWDNARWIAIAVSTVVVLAMLVGGLSRPGPHRGLILSAAGASVVFYVFVTGYALPDLPLLPGSDISVGAYGRYGFLAGALLLIAVIAAGWAMLHFGRRSRPFAWVLVAVLSVIYLAAVISGYGYQAPTAVPMGWRAAVDLARTECASGHLDVVLPVDPSWQVSLPCTVFDQR